jgi:hypothetical protein
MPWFMLVLRLAARCVAHPSIAPDLMAVAWRFRERGWYRHFPFVPLPAMDYVRWRMYTAYGDERATPPVDDVIRYARWARRANRPR